MENNYCVYMHKNKIDGKVYIGSTKNIKTRFGKNGNNYKLQPFYKQIKLYGWDNFEHIILCNNLTKEEAEQKERQLIKEYKSADKDFGYNIVDYKSNKKNNIVHIKISKELNGKLKEQARKKGLSLSGYVRLILIERGK